MSAARLQLLTGFNQVIAIIQVEAQSSARHLAVLFSPQETIGRVARYFTTYQPAKGSGNLTGILTGDVLRLWPILLNLITPAITFTKKGLVTLKM